MGEGGREGEREGSGVGRGEYSINEIVTITRVI